MKGLKKRLDNKKASWVDKLNNVIWVYITTPRSSRRETPFKLTYGMDAVILVEIGPSSYRVLEGINPEVNNLNSQICLDLLEERWEQAAIVSEAQKLKIAGYHNKHVQAK